MSASNPEILAHRPNNQNKANLIMTTRTLTHLYDNHDAAVAAVHALEAAGFSHDHVSVVANNADTRYRTGDAGAHADDVGAAGTGATAGTIFGGGLGLLAGIGSLAIPGVGPVVAAGWLVATLTGAGVGAVVGGGAGGLVGSLTHAGVSEEDAHVYAEGVRRGGSLVTVRADEARVAEAEAILNKGGPVDVGMRRSEYRQAGWQRFDAGQGEFRPASGTMTGVGTRTGETTTGTLVGVRSVDPASSI